MHRRSSTGCGPGLRRRRPVRVSPRGGGVPPRELAQGSRCRWSCLLPPAAARLRRADGLGRHRGRLIRIGPVGGRVPAEVLVAADAEARIYSVGRTAVVTYVFGHNPSARVETSPWSAGLYPGLRGLGGHPPSRVVALSLLRIVLGTVLVPLDKGLSCGGVARFFLLGLCLLALHHWHSAIGRPLDVMSRRSG